MEGGITPAEHLRATLLVSDRLLEALWVHVLGETPDPVDEAKAARDDAIRTLEDAAFASDRADERRVLAVAIEQMEGVWARIIAALASLDQPIPYEPTGYGYRSEGSSRDEPPAPKPDDEPDQQ